MAKKRKIMKVRKVSLPPFPWETDVALPGGGKARLARPVLEEGLVDLDCEFAEGDGLREPRAVARTERVWRTAMPPALRYLNRAAQAAVMDYATAVEAVGASGGTSDPTGGGGGSAGSRCPSLRALQAAERLRHMRAALEEGAGLIVPVREARRVRRGRTSTRVALETLADWVAVDGLSRSEILRRAGAAASNEDAQTAATLAIADMGERLAICCGYVNPTTER